MKVVTIGKKDFDEVVYGAVAFMAAKDIATGKIANKVLAKLEEKATEQDLKAGEALPLYTLNDLSAEFEFEDTEAKFLAAQLDEVFKTLVNARARAVIPLHDALVADG